MGNFVEFDSESGKTRAYLALPAEGSRPGVLLFHTWWGLTDFFTGLADRLAAEGFAVLAPDLYDGRTTSAIDEAKRLVSEVDGDVSIKREVAALDQLLAHPGVRGDKVGVIGLSMGAAYAVWLSALRPEVAAVVLFYGGSDWQPEGFLENTRASFLAFSFTCGLLALFNYLVEGRVPPVLVAVPVAAFLSWPLLHARRIAWAEAGVIAVIALGLWGRWG